MPRIRHVDSGFGSLSQIPAPSFLSTCQMPLQTGEWIRESARNSSQPPMREADSLQIRVEGAVLGACINLLQSESARVLEWGLASDGQLKVMTIVGKIRFPSSSLF